MTTYNQQKKKCKESMEMSEMSRGLCLHRTEVSSGNTHIKGTFDS